MTVFKVLAGALGVVEAPLLALLWIVVADAWRTGGVAAGLTTTLIGAALTAVVACAVVTIWKERG